MNASSRRIQRVYLLLLLLHTLAASFIWQPMLGRVADVWSYPASYICSAAIQALAIPFIWLARRERAATDAIV